MKLILYNLVLAIFMSDPGGGMPDEVRLDFGGGYETERACMDAGYELLESVRDSSNRHRVYGTVHCLQTD